MATAAEILANKMQQASARVDEVIESAENESVVGDIVCFRFEPVPLYVASTSNDAEGNLTVGVFYFDKQGVIQFAEGIPDVCLDFWDEETEKAFVDDAEKRDV